jgi:monoamine oxidase
MDPSLASTSTSAGDPDVLILGAGIAGLAAARSLAERGLRVLVLEARDRVGGRILSLTTPENVTVELGAEFVHGRDPELWKLIDECGAKTVERGGSMLREVPPHDGAPSRLTEDEGAEAGDLFAPLEALEDFSGPDLSFTHWLRSSGVPEQDRAALLGYVEGFNAADANLISAQSLGVQQKAEDATAGDRTWHVRGGYSQLTDHLAARLRELGGQVRLNCTVRGILWQPGQVRVETALGEFRASGCLITLPLGVLQRANSEPGLRIAPEPAALAATRHLVMGDACRFTMVFRERWWESSPHLYPDALRDMSFLFTFGRMPRVWWTPRPESQPSPSITGWAGGPSAAQIAGRSAEDLGRDACRTLAEVFSVPADRVLSALVSTHTHDWAADPFSLGAYSYVRTGGIEASAAMAEPESDTLFFAGEHTDVTGNWGTVHAALRSGLRAASQISRAVTNPR